MLYLPRLTSLLVLSVEGLLLIVEVVAVSERVMKIAGGAGIQKLNIYFPR